MNNLLLVFIVVLLSACAQQGTQPSSASAVHDAEARLSLASPESRRQSRIQWLLDEAMQAYQQQRLTLPAEHNAYALYHDVLRIDANNPRALAGLEQISEVYLDWASQAAREGRAGRVHAMLRRAHMTAAESGAVAGREVQILALLERHQVVAIPLQAKPVPRADAPSVSDDEAKALSEPVEKPVRALAAESLALNAEGVYAFSLATLRKRDKHFVGQLQDLGRQASNAGAVVIIRAPSDQDGRWIYKQMRSGVDKRLRGNIERGSPPTVRFLALP